MMQKIFLKLLSATLLAVWLLLYLLGKGGFVHLFLFIGLAVLLIEIVRIYRQQVPK